MRTVWPRSFRRQSGMPERLVMVQVEGGSFMMGSPGRAVKQAIVIIDRSAAPADDCRTVRGERA